MWKSFWKLHQIEVDRLYLFVFASQLLFIPNNIFNCIEDHPLLHSRMFVKKKLLYKLENATRDEFKKFVFVSQFTLRMLFYFSFFLFLLLLLLKTRIFVSECVCICVSIEHFFLRFFHMTGSTYRCYCSKSSVFLLTIHM